MVLLRHTPPPLITPDYYAATVESITVVQSEKPRLDGSTEYLEWKFAAQVNGETVALTAFSSLKFGKGKKPATARKWVEAILGRSLTTQEVEEAGIDTDILVGQPCRVNIVNHPLDDGTVVNRIADVAPPRERRSVSV